MRRIIPASLCMTISTFSGCKNEGASCQAGDVQACLCPDGSPGLQSCLDDGSGWTVYLCEGGCVDGVPVDCDDDDDCTTDRCDETEQDCVYEDRDEDGDGYVRLGPDGTVAEPPHVLRSGDLAGGFSLVNLVWTGSEAVIVWVVRELGDSIHMNRVGPCE